MKEKVLLNRMLYIATQQRTTTNKYRNIDATKTGVELHIYLINSLSQNEVIELKQTAHPK